MMRLKRVVALCKFRNAVGRWVFYVGIDAGGRPYLQIHSTGPKKSDNWHGRKWWLSFHMTDQEVIGTCFRAVNGASEYEVRRRFRYRGEPIYQGHLDPEALVELCRARRFQQRAREPL